MSPKRGLGRGLDALLGDAGTDGQERLRQLAVSRIKPNPFQPRKTFDETALGELRQSIAEYGILVPIIVREVREGFELIAGERRWRAAAAMQLPTIPAIVRSADDKRSLEVAIVENLQRENLGPLEEAAGFAHLMDEHGFTQERLAERLGKSRPAIANALRLLSLSDGIKAMLADGRLSAGHARALLAAPPELRLALAERAVREELSVRVLERLASVTDASPAPARAGGVAPSPERDEFERQLRFRFGTHVRVRPSGTGGKIEIRFGSENDLIRIGEILLRS
ncbi:MAG: ParB/RepB/Spo0J family partition protein [Candidatus Eremiobacteraeota bacterium]|nr:ParB/RepB/Spo0J family partition protein [Candidatus Eremiobacteraeota bacterium]